MNPPDPNEILKRVVEMQEQVVRGVSRQTLENRFEDLKKKSPRIFEMVFENSPDYFVTLKRMVDAANIVRSGEVPLEEMDKKVGLELAKAYIYPNIDMSKEEPSSSS